MQIDGSDRVSTVLGLLDEAYPVVKCALDHRTPYELLVATMLSAQTTDKQVNIVTKGLFGTASTPQAMVALGVEGVVPYIRSCGLYRNKAENIVAASKRLIEEFGGDAPRDRDTLTTLPGVGRKTANVVVSNAFGIPAMAVDTHVFRVANRIGLAHGKTPEQVEDQLTAAIPEDRWTRTHHQIIAHGRGVCDAKRPRCGECTLRDTCEYHQCLQEQPLP